jgi:hypothetical protein
MPSKSQGLRHRAQRNTGELRWAGGFLGSKNEHASPAPQRPGGLLATSLPSWLREPLDSPRLGRAAEEKLGAAGKRRRPGHRSGGLRTHPGRQGLSTPRAAGGLPGACRHQGAKRARCSLLFSYHSANWGVQTCRWGQSRSQRARISCWASSLARRSRKCSIARRLKLTTKCWR